MKRWTALVLLCCVSLPLWAAGGSTQVAQIEAGHDTTRILLPLAGPAEHTLLSLDDPPRLVIDLRGAGVPARVLGLQAPGSVVSRVRSGARETGELRVVFDLAERPKRSSARLEKNQDGEYRLAVELRHSPRAVAVATSRPPTPAQSAVSKPATAPVSTALAERKKEREAAPTPPRAARSAGSDMPRPAAPAVAVATSAKPTAAADAEKLVAQAKSVTAARPAGNKTVIVAVDAGHGGKDPGAAGKRGTREKDVTLAIARELARRIDREPGMKAVLTRDGDYFLSLRQRIQIARKHQADVFVSVHADAFQNTASQGSSVYVLSQRGASDEAARWLAARENAADLAGGIKLKDKDDVLAQVLLDLSQTATADSSFQLADRVLGELGRLGPLHKEAVQQAGFLVLKSPDIPSILVETAFITNPGEERRLGDPGHQRRIASAIFSGVRGFAAERIPNARVAAVESNPEAALQTLSLAGDSASPP